MKLELPLRLEFRSCISNKLCHDAGHSCPGSPIEIDANFVQVLIVTLTLPPIYMGPKQLKSASATPHPTGGKSKIFWEKGYACRTDQFIEWSQDNPAKCVKLFSDSTQDA
jgi:hypothetical protein